MRKYSHQAVLAFDKSGTGFFEGLESTLQRKQGENVPIIYHDSVDEETLRHQLRHLDHQSRLYISAHGTDKTDHAYEVRNLGGQQAREADQQDIQSWSPIELANILEKSLPSSLIGSTNSKSFFGGCLCINLIICFAGMERDNSHLNSFAAKLQTELARRSIYVDIKARTTIVGVNRHDGSKSTTKIGHEAELNQIQARSRQLKQKQKEVKTYAGNHQLLMDSLDILQKEDELCIRHQPNSKILLKWVSEGDELTQVAYDAYEVRQHEQEYSNIKAIVEELRTYADERKESPDHQEAVKQARTLATNIEKEADHYFNGTDKTSTKTEQFKKVCSGHIKTANHELGRHRHSLLRRIIGKLALGVASVLGLSAPYFVHRHLIKKGHFSTGLFSNKTRGRQLTDKLSKTVNQTHSIKRLE